MEGGQGGNDIKNKNNNNNTGNFDGGVEDYEDFYEDDDPFSQQPVEESSGNGAADE